MKHILQCFRRTYIFALLFVLFVVLISGCTLNDANAKAKESLLLFYDQLYSTQVYWEEQEPKLPQVGDVRLESLELLGESELEGCKASLYTVSKSILGQQEGVLQWVTMEPSVEVLIWAEDGGTAEILTPNFSIEGLSPEQIIQQTVLGLLSWEVSLWRESHDCPIGIGTEVSHIMESSDGQEMIEIRGEEYAAPIYQDGDWYELHCWESLTVNCYHMQAEERCSARHITCTHPDLYTPRGIHVGSTREDVQAAYPEASNEPFWDWQGGYLCYQPWEGDFGPAILFVFQVKGQVYDTVQAIFLVNMEG